MESDSKVKKAIKARELVMMNTRNERVRELIKLRPDLDAETIIRKAGEVGARIYTNINAILAVSISRASEGECMPWETPSYDKSK